jgi:hypothetical protein
MAARQRGAHAHRIADCRASTACANAEAMPRVPVGLRVALAYRRIVANEFALTGPGIAP